MLAKQDHEEILALVTTTQLLFHQLIKLIRRFIEKRHRGEI